MQPHAGHQPLLIEYEGIDALQLRRSCKAARHALVHDDDARTYPQLPAALAIQEAKRVVVHQEQSVAKVLDTDLQTIGRRRNAVISNSLAPLAQGPHAELTTEDEACLGDRGKDEDGLGRSGEFDRCGVACVECGQGRIHLTVDSVGGRGGGCLRKRRAEANRQEEACQQGPDMRSPGAIRFHVLTPIEPISDRTGCLPVSACNSALGESLRHIRTRRKVAPKWRGANFGE